MKTIETKHAPAALGPYSQAKKVGNLVFLSGQIGINPETGKLAEGLEAQAEQVCANIEAVLKKAGADMEAVAVILLYYLRYPRIVPCYALSQSYPLFAYRGISSHFYAHIGAGPKFLHPLMSKLMWI